MKLKLSNLTPKIIWYFYWDHIECIDVFRELGICTIYSLKFFLACPTSPPPVTSCGVQAGEQGDRLSPMSEVGLIKDVLSGEMGRSVGMRAGKGWKPREGVMSGTVPQGVSAWPRRGSEVRIRSKSSRREWGSGRDTSTINHSHEPTTR